MIRHTTMGPVLTRWRRTFGCLATDPGYLLHAFSLVLAVRLGLCVLPVRTIGRLLSRLAQRKQRGLGDPSLPDRVARAVQRASRMVPGATCLTQALVAQVLLERRGLPTRLQIGVRDRDQAMHAHAWLESRGKTVIGGGSPGEWTPFLTVEGVQDWSTLGRGWW
jgi:hypothetical protein